MGSRDFRRRETKKSKKDAKKGSVVLEQPSMERVDVIRKGKKERVPEVPERVPEVKEPGPEE